MPPAPSTPSQAAVTVAVGLAKRQFSEWTAGGRAKRASTNPFACGYLWGMASAFAIDFGLDKEADVVLGVAARTFHEIFGVAEGDASWRRTIDSFDSEDVKRGTAAGTQDATRFVQTKVLPNQLKENLAY